jgi:transposase
VSARSDWYSIMPVTTRRSGRLSDRWPRRIGCPVEVLRRWVRQAERDAGQRPGLTTEERARLKHLERENVELKRANEILRKASAFFAQAELDRRPK